MVRKRVGFAGAYTGDSVFTGTMSVSGAIDADSGITPGSLSVGTSTGLNAVKTAAVDQALVLMGNRVDAANTINVLISCPTALTGTARVLTCWDGSAERFAVLASGEIRATTLALSESDWDGGHLVMGSYHLWVDSTGDLRIKSGAPSNDTDGTVVGTQS